MSAHINLYTQIQDKQCLLKALDENKETYSERAGAIIIQPKDLNFSISFHRWPFGYHLFSNPDEDHKKISDWLNKITISYKKHYNEKSASAKGYVLQEFREMQRTYMAIQEKNVSQKAKELGYRIEQRYNSSDKIRLVLVRDKV